MTSGQLSPEDTAQDSALDGDAAPATGSEPDTAGDQSESAAAPTAAGTTAAPKAGASADVTPSEDAAATTSPERASLTVLDGPALENEDMREATEELRASETASAEASEIARDLSAATEPDRQD